MALNAIFDQFLYIEMSLEVHFSLSYGHWQLRTCPPPPVHKGERENSVPGFYVGIKNSHELGG